MSDGLSTDLAHLCEASGVQARVEAARVPIHPLAGRLGAERGLALALNGGEDYELLFTARPETRLPRQVGGVPLTRIGTIARRTGAGPMMTLVDAAGQERPLERGGWEHLR